MSVRMVILGLLLEKPRYGYEIKQLIEQRMGDWADIPFGSIYYALNKLADEGKLDRNQEKGDPGRPVRYVYTISGDGLEEFRELLDKAWKDEGRLKFPFDLAYYFEDQLPEAEKYGLLEEKKRKLQRSLAYLEGHRTGMEGDPMIPAMAAEIVRHSQLHYEAELKWIEELLENRR